MPRAYERTSGMRVESLGSRTGSLDRVTQPPAHDRRPTSDQAVQIQMVATIFFLFNGQWEISDAGPGF
jgi:hypothetical protein